MAVQVRQLLKPNHSDRSQWSHPRLSSLRCRLQRQPLPLQLLWSPWAYLAWQWRKTDEVWWPWAVIRLLLAFRRRPSRRAVEPLGIGACDETKHHCWR